MDPSEAWVRETSLVFTPQNWDKPQTVKINGVDDSIVDGDQSFNITAGIEGSDNAMPERLVKIGVTNLDNDNSGISIRRIDGKPQKKRHLTTTEEGGSSQFEVLLNAQPTRRLKVTLSGLDATEGSLSKEVLQFRPDTWNKPQTVRLKGVSDEEIDGDIKYRITARAAKKGGYTGMEKDSITIINIDNNQIKVKAIRPVIELLDERKTLITSESGSSDQFQVMLNRQPSRRLKVKLSGLDETEGRVKNGMLIFTPKNWNTPQKIKVSGVADVDSDGDKSYKIFAAIEGNSSSRSRESESVEVVNLDKGSDIYLLMDTSTSMLQSDVDGETPSYQKLQGFAALKTFFETLERSGYAFKKKKQEKKIPVSDILSKLANLKSDLHQSFWRDLQVIDQPDDQRVAESVNLHLINYDYAVHHQMHKLSAKNPASAIDIAQKIIGMETAHQQYGNTVKGNPHWKTKNLPDPKEFDLYQVSNNKPSNLYSGTEMLGALEGLEFLLNQQAETTKRAHRSTTVAMITDGRPERRSWWDTRINPVSDSIVGQSISLPESLGGEEITTSGLLYDKAGKPHYITNNDGKLQWKQMRRDLNKALDNISSEVIDPKQQIRVEIIGLGERSHAKLSTIHKDLFENQTFNNMNGKWYHLTESIRQLNELI